MNLSFRSAKTCSSQEICTFHRNYLAREEKPVRPGKKERRMNAVLDPGKRAVFDTKTCSSQENIIQILTSCSMSS